MAGQEPTLDLCQAPADRVCQHFFSNTCRLTPSLNFFSRSLKNVCDKNSSRLGNSDGGTTEAMADLLR